MSLAQSSGGSVKKMLIVPKMQPQSLCEFIKSFNGIRFVVYKWRKEFPTFSVSRDQLERAWTLDHTRHWPDEALLRERREAATSIRAVSRFPCDDKLFAKTEGFFLRSSKLFLSLTVNNSPSLSNFQLMVRNKHLDHKIMQL